MKCSSIIHLDNTFRAGVQGNFRQPEYGKAINTWVGRTSLLKLMAIPVGIRGQHLEVWQMDCKERTLWMPQGKPAAKGSYRQMAGTAPKQGPEISILQWELCMRKDCCFRPTKSVGKVV